jgi:transposase
MSRKIEPAYGQLFLLPPSLEDWVGPEHPARYIREFVASVDLEAAGIHWGSASLRGQPGYTAELLLRVHLYARFLGIRSYRKMEEACKDNLGMLWLTGLLVPDHSTLWDFFQANRRGLREVFKCSVQVALQTELIGLSLHALDGTKMQAAVANATGWHRASLSERQAQLAEAIAEVEAQLERSGEETAGTRLDLPQRLQETRALHEAVGQALGELAASGQSHLHPADRDARVMKCRDKGTHTFCYNDQVVVDAQSGLIVAEATTTAAEDHGQLAGMLDEARATLGAGAETTVADGGYASSAQFALVEERGESVVVNLSDRLIENPAKPFAGSNFRYDEATDTVICPLGERLEYTHSRWHSAKQERLRCYRCRRRDCPVRAACTKDRKGRKIELGEHHAALQRQRDKLREPLERAKLAKRRYIVEPVFAWIKQQLGFRRHTVFGLESARTEWSLIAATYNLHRLYRWWRAGKLPGWGSSKAVAAKNRWIEAFA